MNSHITASRQVHVWLHDGGVSTATIAAPPNATAAAATRSTGGGSGVTVPLLVASQSVRRRRKGGQEHCIVPKVAFLATLLNAPLSTDRPSTAAAAAAPTMTTMSREQREEMDEQEEQQQHGQHLPPRPGAVQFQLPGQDDNEPQSRRHHNQLQQSFTESDDPDEERYGGEDAEEEQEWVLFVQQHGRPEGFWGHAAASEEASSSERRRRRRRMRRLYLSNSNHPSSSGRPPLNHHHHHPLLNTDAYSRIHPAVPTALAALDCVAVLVAILSSTWDDVLSPVIIVLAGFVSNMLFFIAVTWRSGIWLQTAVLLLLTLNVLVLFRLQVMDILLSRLLLVAGQMICVARMRTFAELSVYFLT